MNRQTLRANFLLFVAAAIWGSAFVAQKVGMDAIGPFWYTGLRFALGTVIIAPLLFIEKPTRPIVRSDWMTGIGIGLLLFAGINLQQVALIYTTVANTGFITGLYVALVPVICLFWGHRYGAGVWVGVLMALIGLYLLSVRGDFQINPGDLLTLLSAFFWAFQVIALSSSGHCLPPVRLAVTQFSTCVVLSVFVALFREPISLEIIGDAGIPLLYGGIMSVGFGFTIQVVAQRYAHAAHSAIILSLESVVAAFAGWLVLNETLDSRALIGCLLMLAGTIVAQLSPAAVPTREPVADQAAS